MNHFFVCFWGIFSQKCEIFRNFDPDSAGCRGRSGMLLCHKDRPTYMSYHMQAIVRTIITNEKIWIFSKTPPKKTAVWEGGGGGSDAYLARFRSFDPTWYPKNSNFYVQGQGCNSSILTKNVRAPDNQFHIWHKRVYASKWNYARVLFCNKKCMYFIEQYWNGVQSNKNIHLFLEHKKAFYKKHHHFHSVVRM